MSLFKEFAGASQEEWIEKVKKDLKGKAIEVLDWKLEEGLTLKPFYSSENTKAANIPISNTNNWDISEDVRVDVAKEANQKALNSLMNGVSAPTFIFDKDATLDDLITLLKDIEMSFITAHFEVDTSNSAKAFYIFEAE